MWESKQSEYTYIALVAFVILIIIVVAFEISVELRDGLEFVVEIDGLLSYNLAIDVDEVLDRRCLLLDFRHIDVSVVVAAVPPSSAPTISIAAVVLGVSCLAVLDAGQSKTEPNLLGEVVEYRKNVRVPALERTPGEIRLRVLVIEHVDDLVGHLLRILFPRQEHVAQTCDGRADRRQSRAKGGGCVDEVVSERDAVPTCDRFLRKDEYGVESRDRTKPTISCMTSVYHASTVVFVRLGPLLLKTFDWPP
jgi:hypothetical protein